MIGETDRLEDAAQQTGVFGTPDRADEWMIRKVAIAQPFARRQRVVRGRQEDKPLSAEYLGVYASGLALSKKQAEVDVAVTNLLNRLIERSDIGNDLDTRIRPGKSGERFGMQMVADEPMRSNGTDVVSYRLQRTDIRHGPVRPGQNVFGMIVNPAANIGQRRRPPAPALEDWFAQMRFQRANVHADRRLGDIERGRCSAERAGIDDVPEDFQLSQGYRKHGRSIRPNG